MMPLDRWLSWWAAEVERLRAIWPDLSDDELNKIVEANAIAKDHEITGGEAWL